MFKEIIYTKDKAYQLVRVLKEDSLVDGQWGFVHIGRGCVFSCTFCINSIHKDPTVRLRSVDRVIAEIKDMLGKCKKVKSIFFMDEIFPVRSSFLKEFCEKYEKEINLPFQAGDNEILKNMRRGYTREDYKNLVYKIRDKVPDISLSTDLIVGFCGETDGQFDNTLDMIREIKFDKVHSAAYSTRTGTIADRQMVDNVPGQVKKDRLKKINTEQEKIVTEINSKLKGQTQEILIEGQKEGKWIGRNSNVKLVFVNDASAQVGKLLNVQIEETSPWYLKGSAVQLI